MARSWRSLLMGVLQGSPSRNHGRGRRWGESEIRTCVLLTLGLGGDTDRLLAVLRGSELIVVRRGRAAIARRAIGRLRSRHGGRAEQRRLPGAVALRLEAEENAEGDGDREDQEADIDQPAEVDAHGSWPSSPSVGVLASSCRYWTCFLSLRPDDWVSETQTTETERDGGER